MMFYCSGGRTSSTAHSQFEVVEDNDTRHFMGLQEREDAGAYFAGLRYTTLMEVLDI